jgi:hypothetical protein
MSPLKIIVLNVQAVYLNLSSVLRIRSGEKCVQEQWGSSYSCIMIEREGNAL